MDRVRTETSLGGRVSTPFDELQHAALTTEAERLARFFGQDLELVI